MYPPVRLCICAHMITWNMSKIMVTVGTWKHLSVGASLFIDVCTHVCVRACVCQCHCMCPSVFCRWCKWKPLIPIRYPCCTGVRLPSFDLQHSGPQRTLPSGSPSLFYFFLSLSGALSLIPSFYTSCSSPLNMSSSLYGARLGPKKDMGIFVWAPSGLELKNIKNIRIVPWGL